MPPVDIRIKGLDDWSVFGSVYLLTLVSVDLRVTIPGFVKMINVFSFHFFKGNG